MAKGFTDHNGHGKTRRTSRQAWRNMASIFRGNGTKELRRPAHPQRGPDAASTTTSPGTAAEGRSRFMSR